MGGDSQAGVGAILSSAHVGIGLPICLGRVYILRSPCNNSLVQANPDKFYFRSD